MLKYLICIIIGIILYILLNRRNGFSIGGDIETLKYMSSEEIDSRFDISVQIYRGETYIEVVDKDFYQRYLYKNDLDILVYDSKKNKIFVITKLGHVIYNEKDIINLLTGEEVEDMDPAKFLIERKLKHIIESIRETPQIESYYQVFSSLDSNVYVEDWWREEKNIHFLYLDDKMGCYIKDFDKIKYFTQRLSELNELLKKKCPNLELKMDNYHRLPGEITSLSGPSIFRYKLLLCLYYEGNCISSVELHYIENNAIEIESETHKDYKRKKYNLLLRSSIIYICIILICNTEEIQYIVSDSINPVSSYTLIKNFDVMLKFDNHKDEKKYQEIIKENLALNKEITLEQIKSFTDNPYITIELTEENLHKAKNIFDELTKDGGALICP